MPDNLLDDVGAAQRISAARQQQAQQAALAPGNLQLQQGQIQGQGIQNQMGQTELQQKQLQLQDQQGISQALRDSYGSPGGTSSSPQAGPSAVQMGGISQLQTGQPSGGKVVTANPTDRLTDLVGRIQDPKYRISPQGQMALMEQINGLQQKLAITDKDTLGNIETAHKLISQGLNSVLESAPEDQAAQWTIERNQLMRNPTLAKFAGAIPAQYPGQPVPGGSPEAQTALHSLMAEQDIVAATKQKAELPGEQAKSRQAVQAAAPPTGQQISDAIKTVSTYEGISPAEREGLKSEIMHAPDFETLQKVQARADAAQSSGQMKQATLAQARAMMGNKFAEAGLTKNDAIWTDPHSGFAGALAQANQTKNSIQAGVDGNGLLTAMVPTMEVLGINHAAGISRISPAEAAAAQVPVEWATRWNAWATKAASGKLTPEVAKQGQQLMDVVIDAAHQRAVQSSQLIAKGHGVDPRQMPAMDRQGNLTTLDQAGRAKQSGGAITVTDPNGGVHTFPDQKSADSFKRAAGIK